MPRLIDNARHAHKLASVQLAALAGLAAGYLAANPEQTEALLALLPDGPLRVLASAGIGLFVFGMAAGSRVVKQGKLAPPGDE
jgi:hypothetical protein